MNKQPPEVFCKKGVRKNFAKFTGKHLSRSLFFNKELQARGVQLYLKMTLQHVFSFEFSEVFKITFFTEHFRATSSAQLNNKVRKNIFSRKNGTISFEEIAAAIKYVPLPLVALKQSFSKNVRVILKNMSNVWTLQNLHEKTCVGVSFLITLKA